MLRRNLLPTSFTASPNSSDFFHHRRLDMLEEESTVPSTVEGPTRVANAQPSSGIPHDVLTNHPQQRKGTISERDINDDPVHPPSENRKYPLDKKARFWEEYDRYAHKYDDELVKGLSDDLNSLLIFAGLFSATNTAFILEIMKDLKGDPLDTTNHLLQALIRVHDANHVAASTEEPQISVPDKRTVRVNAFFFASLCCSIFAAFGAVLGKQWLNHYDHEGPPKSLPEKGRDRQIKLMGLERWHVHGILQLLPSFLQIALFFFLVGLIDWLWPLSRMVAGVVFGFTLVTLLFYIVTTAVAMYDPGSPFQSRISRTAVCDALRVARLMVISLHSRRSGPWSISLVYLSEFLTSISITFHSARHNRALHHNLIIL
ncbi:hypothetical protein FRC02_002002 [Tulasnella sp. 418]|nr:hypothetical protein FRC02_002002 [Tulasnella sp. 418]